MNEDALAEIQTKYPRVKVITIGEAEFVIRAPKRHEYKAFRAKGMNPDTRADATEDLARLLVVHCRGVTGAEARLKFDELLDEWPGLCESKDVSIAIEQFVGMKADDQGKGSASTSPSSAAGPARSPTA